MPQLNPQQFGSVTQDHWKNETPHYSEGGNAPYVEHVPVSELQRFADPNVPVHRLISQEKGYLENLGGSMLSEGVKQPVVLGYNHKTRKAMIYDGMHRLAVSQDQGISHLPTRVVRRGTMEGGAPVPGHTMEGHVPEDLRPSQIGLPMRKP